MQTRVTEQCKQESSREFSKKFLAVVVAGGAAFWVTDFIMAVSPIAAAYKTAFSFTSLPVALVEALAGGLVIAFGVSFFLFRFLNSLPGKNSVHKALNLSFGAMAIIEILSAIGNPAHAFVYLVLDTGMNIPRFLALGWTIGFVFGKQNRKVLR
jgi:hypothetical protein